MITGIQDCIDKFLAFVLLPATVYGAGGGMLRAYRSGKHGFQVILEGASGVLVAHMCGPLIVEYVPKPWEYPCVFLAGWGGLELVGRAYTLAMDWLAAKILASMPHTAHDDLGDDHEEHDHHDRTTHISAEHHRNHKHGDD